MVEAVVYTIPEAAQLLSVSVGTVRRLIQEGRLEAVKIRGSWRIKKASIDKLLEQK